MYPNKERRSQRKDVLIITQNALLKEQKTLIKRLQAIETELEALNMLDKLDEVEE